MGRKRTFVRVRTFPAWRRKADVPLPAEADVRGRYGGAGTPDRPVRELSSSCTRRPAAYPRLGRRVLKAVKQAPNHCSIAPKSRRAYIPGTAKSPMGGVRRLSPRQQPSDQANDGSSAYNSPVNEHPYRNRVSINGDGMEPRLVTVDVALMGDLNGAAAGLPPHGCCVLNTVMRSSRSISSASPDLQELEIRGGRWRRGLRR
jgi:hypothetical protein